MPNCTRADNAARTAWAGCGAGLGAATRDPKRASRDSLSDVVVARPSDDVTTCCVSSAKGGSTGAGDAVVTAGRSDVWTGVAGAVVGSGVGGVRRCGAALVAVGVADSRCGAAEASSSTGAGASTAGSKGGSPPEPSGVARANHADNAPRKTSNAALMSGSSPERGATADSGVTASRAILASRNTPERSTALRRPWAVAISAARGVLASSTLPASRTSIGMSGRSTMARTLAISGARPVWRGTASVAATRTARASRVSGEALAKAWAAADAALADGASAAWPAS
jgi:hypothetical protein